MMQELKIAIDVHCYRRQPNPELTAWLDGWRESVPSRMVYSQYDICLARRQSLANFLRDDVPAGYTHLVQIDEDMVPVGATDAILTATGDLVYCGYRGQRGRRGHYGDGDFGCGCSRISADLAGKVNVATSFDFALDADRLAVVACECDVFRRQAESLGYASRMVGVVGHLVEMVAVPEAGAMDLLSLRWPAGA
jgi:hypothetical protein